MRPETKSLSFLAHPYLSGYTGRSQATVMSKPDKTFPLLILPTLPNLHNPGVWTVRVQIEWLPIQSRVVVLIMSTCSEGWQTGPYMRGQSFCSHLTRLSQHLRPSPKPGSPWSSILKGDKSENPSSYTILKSIFFWKLTPFLKSFVTNISRIDCGKRLGGHTNLSQNHIMHKITGWGLWLKNHR
jgi:hypothetical protein